MYCYTEFKFQLQHHYHLSPKNIYFIIGIFFEFTNGFENQYDRYFFEIKQGKSIYISWSPETYGWDITEKNTAELVRTKDQKWWQQQIASNKF